uniref:Uncharacterized protein n=1 Tax=Zea mays TaxID=4577 RepID=A0A804UJ75_MAIZE
MERCPASQHGSILLNSMTAGSFNSESNSTERTPLAKHEASQQTQRNIGIIQNGDTRRQKKRKTQCHVLSTTSMF